MLPGRWIESRSPPGGGRDTAPKPQQPWQQLYIFDNNNPQRQRMNVTVVSRVKFCLSNIPLRHSDLQSQEYDSSEKLTVEFWDHRRLAEHVSAVMSKDSAPAAVGFILE